MNNKKLCVSNMVENEQQAKVVDLPSSACSAPPEAVREWLEMELRCYRYWCVAGPAGSGWREYNIADKPKYQESRDWIEKVLGKSIECDPWKDQRILEQNIRDQEREASSESDSSNQGNPGL